MPRTIGRLFIKLLVIGTLAYLGFCALVYLIQDSLVFIPAREIYRTPAQNGWAYEEVNLPVDGNQTFAWYVPAPENRRGVVLFSHGNAGNLADRIESIGIWRALGFDVLAYDYGGYGNSTGKPSERRCYADIRAMYRWLRNVKQVPPDRIVLFGRSMGAGPALQLAVEVDCGAVIVESTFRSVPKVAGEIYPWLPVRLLSRNTFDNEARIAAVERPVLVAHSPDDTIIPIEHGRAIFEAANEPKVFFEFRGDHNEGFWLSGETYRAGLDAFLREHFDGNGTHNDDVGAISH